MSNLRVETNRATLISDGGVEYEACLGYDIDAASGLPFLSVRVYKDGTFVGQPMRLKMAGDRVAADLPGVSDEFFITDSGHITNG